MIGMSFGSFLTLLILGFIAAIIMHAGFRYRMMAGFDGFLAKWVAGWIGAWLGTPVLGHWWLQIQNVYIIPALVGGICRRVLPHIRAESVERCQRYRREDHGSSSHNPWPRNVEKGQLSKSKCGARHPESLTPTS